PQSLALPPFVPRMAFRNGHVMTVAAWRRARTYPGLPPGEPRLFTTTPDTTVLAHVYWQSDRASRPTLLALHGLEGSIESHYMRGLASEAWARGWNAVLLNQRNCGGTEHLTPGLYHSGLTEDPFEVLAQLRSEGLSDFGIVGYSLGGNLALRMAGELATRPALAGLPVRAVAAVSPTMDLALCVDAIERPLNIFYQWHFMRNLRARMRRKAALWPGQYDLAPLDSLRTIREFDDAYTAPRAGFGTAANYYHQASAMRLIDRVTVPTLIIGSEDDPFEPPEQFRRPEVTGNPHVRMMVSRHGGHCGFVSADGYYAESTALTFLSAFRTS
ncbi:MAG: alpha/beta fold hydrolase, partial [Acidobacteria bacterium]